MPNTTRAPRRRGRTLRGTSDGSGIADDDDAADRIPALYLGDRRDAGLHRDQDCGAIHLGRLCVSNPLKKSGASLRDAKATEETSLTQADREFFNRAARGAGTSVVRP
ncbi:MAG: hypothetical protein KJ057_11325 [Phycisphaerae bacterium]|nr:hypothetical protein [Planctomycetia bacterium]MCK6465717.1 hypothetical protein [Phycisphaerae bacterium]MCL4719051.1 hypothetical protein [Phycisphaerae bacterium]NUQ08994.1 hypothetical protein [Phycisphaerae bacterium]